MCKHQLESFPYCNHQIKKLVSLCHPARQDINKICVGYGTFERTASWTETDEVYCFICHPWAVPNNVRWSEVKPVVQFEDYHKGQSGKQPKAEGSE